MVELSDIAGNGASVVGGKSVGKSVVNDRGWFADACISLFPHGKAGTALWADTGVGERDCQRYAAGTVRPSGGFVRALLRTPNGWTWLCAIMDGCSVAWWVELQHMRRLVEAIKREEARRE